MFTNGNQEIRSQKKSNQVYNEIYSTVTTASDGTHMIIYNMQIQNVFCHTPAFIIIYIYMHNVLGKS